MTRHDPARRFAALLVATCLFVLAVPSVALAHSELDTPTPADKSTVTEPVLQVSGTFTEPIKTDGSSLLVKDSTGVTVAQGGVDATDNKVMIATPAIPLPNGTYTVQWTTVSADDNDIARGTWSFAVAVATPTATPAASATAAATTAPSAATTTAPSAAPTPTPAATAAPSPSPSGSGSNTGSGGDVILPIIVALIILGAGAAYLLSRRGRTTPGT